MDSKSLLDIAKEAIKPASGIIDALLAPKVARFREWANERDLQDKVEFAQLNLDLFFDAYLKRLLARISSLKTIVFSQTVLSLPEIYEPVSIREQLFRQYQDKEQVVAESEVLQPGTYSYLIDGAGMGKSTFTKHLILGEIANRERIRIPLFFELRRVESGETLLAALARDLDEPGRKFPPDVLERLFTRVDFFIVLDGFDEVSTANRKALMQQIEALAQLGERNTILLTSRPEVELPLLPKARTLSFVPLSNEQSASLVRRYDRAGRIDVGERLIERFADVPEEFLRTPLLVTLLYRTFGFNNSISSNIRTFYEELFIALYKGHDLTKAGFNREKFSQLEIDSFRRLFRFFSFLAIANEINSFSTKASLIRLIDQAIEITGVKPFSSDSYQQDLLACVPLLVRDGTEYRFVHKTIAEYFAAEFIAFDGDSAKILGNIYDKSLFSRYDKVLRFLKEIQPKMLRQHITARVAKSVLEYKPDQHPIIRTLGFFAQKKISLWNINRVPNTEEVQNLFGLDVPSVQWSVIGSTISKKQLVFVVVSIKSESAVPLCFESITKPIMPGKYAQRRFLVNAACEELITKFPVETWFSIDDSVIEELIDNDELKHRLIACIPNFVNDFTQHTGKLNKMQNKEYRVLDDQRAKLVLKQVADDLDAQSLVADMV